jgi:Kef-type K+ transport system membrane component KefB
VTAGLLLILIVAAAYLAAHVAMDWIGRRYLIVSGAEYLLLGVLLGPQVSGVIRTSTVDEFAPFLTLAFGWVGALVGAQFYVPDLLRLRTVAFKTAFTEAVLSLAVTSGIMGVLIWWWFGLTIEEATVPALAIGAIAVASAPAGIAVVARQLGERGPVLEQLHVATAVDAVVAILTFGILLAVSHGAPPEGIRPPTPTEWVAISLGIGLVGGALFHLFVGQERNSDRLFIALAGALILCSGAAAHLRLSPLLPAMLVGIVLVNTMPRREELAQLLTRVERPLYFVLLIFAGAAWAPGRGAWALPVVAFVLVRTFAKVGGARLAARANGVYDALGRHWGLGLVGHGGLAVAIALNYRLSDDSLLPNVVFTAAIASVLLTDFFSARIVHAVVTRGSTGRPREESDVPADMGEVRS